MAEETYESLLAHIQEQEHRKLEMEREIRQLQHALKKVQAEVTAKSIQVKTIQTVNLGIFSMLEPAEIFRLSCSSVVHQLQWDAAYVIELNSNRTRVIASSQADDHQINHIRDYLSTNPYIREAYSTKSAVTTRTNNQQTAYSLQALFGAEQVVMMPILFGENFYGYLVACAKQASPERTMEEVDFLAILASLIGHAVQNTTNFLHLEEQNAKLRKLDELKDSFISITSHQLRTPLSIIKWILSILQGDEEIKKLAESHKLIEQAYVSNERLIHVVNDLLNVSRIQEGILPYNPQTQDVKVILQDLANSVQRLVEDKKLYFIATIDKEVPTLQLDPILFKEAVQNLLDNAVDYSKDGGTINLELDRADGEVIIRVRNQGHGIDPEERENVFNQFYRSKSAVSMHPNGNGLGLYLTKAIVSAHGGTITCESVIDDTTTFTIRIPETHG